MNKHGFARVRKRLDGRAKPFYAKRKVAGETFNTGSFATAAEAASAAQRPIKRLLKFLRCTCGRCP